MANFGRHMIIRGGTVITPEGATLTDIAVKDGRITTIAPARPPARNDIDAGGLHVLPEQIGRITSTAPGLPAEREEIDARGLHVLPGQDWRIASIAPGLVAERNRIDARGVLP